MEQKQLKNGSTRSYYIFIICLYFFLLKEWAERIIGMIGYIDELIALFAIPLFLIQFGMSHGKLLLKNLLRELCIIITFLCGLLGNLYFKYQPIAQAAIPDILICLKFWLCIYVGRFSLKMLDLKIYAKKIFSHIKLITYAYTALIILDNVYPVFYAELRYGLRSTQLFYGHAFVFASCCVVLLTILMIIHESIPHREFIIYSIWLSILMSTTLRSRAWGCALFYWLIYYLVFIRKKKFTVKTLILFIPVVVAVGWNQIVYYFFSDIQNNSARYQLLTKSIQIAKDCFPFGAGFATFGSHYSAVVYSPLYFKYGISNVHGLREGNAWFVNDAYWAMVLGQFGWIGLIATLVAVGTLFNEIQKHRKSSPSNYSACLFILVYLLIESTSSSAFVHPLSIPLALLLGYLLGRQRRWQRTLASTD